MRVSRSCFSASVSANTSSIGTVVAGRWFAPTNTLNQVFTIMKNLVSILCLLLFASAHAQSPTVAIRGVTVVDVRDGSLHPVHTVLVAGNRIAAVGPVHGVAVPDDAKIVEATGGYLIPGLWDMHVHSVANIAVDRAIASVSAYDWHFPLFLAHGVTGVRNMNDGTGDLTLKLNNSVRRRRAR